MKQAMRQSHEQDCSILLILWQSQALTQAYCQFLGTKLLCTSPSKVRLLFQLSFGLLPFDLQLVISLHMRFLISCRHESGAICSSSRSGGKGTSRFPLSNPTGVAKCLFTTKIKISTFSLNGEIIEWFKFYLLEFPLSHEIKELN